MFIMTFLVILGEQLSLKILEESMIKIEHKMKKVFLFLSLVFIIASCKGNGLSKDENNPEPQKPEAKDIVITSVTLGNKSCSENSTTSIEEKNAELVITFAEKYEELKVTVNEKDATISEKTARYQVKDLSTIDTDIKIVAKAKNKNDKNYSFKARLMSQKDIVITSVTLENKSCSENSTVSVEEKSAELVITFAEKYEELKVTVNEKDATISEKTAKYQLKDLSTTDTDIKIVAKAKNKDDKSYSFKVRLMSQVEILELKFVGDGLNPSGTGLFDKKTITYSSTKPPLLSDIKEDGSTNVGTTTSFEVLKEKH